MTLIANVQVLAGATIATAMPVSAHGASPSLHQNVRLVSSDVPSLKPDPTLKNGDYEPPPNIGGPGRSQGSGTR